MGYNTTVESIYLPLVYTKKEDCNTRILLPTKTANILIHEKAAIANVAFVVMYSCHAGATNNR